MKGPVSPALIRRKNLGKSRICDSDTSATPKISTHRRSLSITRAAKADQAEMIAIWDRIENEYAYQLSQNPQKHKCKKRDVRVECQEGYYYK